MPYSHTELRSADTRLTTYSLARGMSSQADLGLVALSLFPAFQQVLRNLKYYTYPNNEHLKLVETLRAPGTEPNRVQRSLSTASLLTHEHALMEEVTGEADQEADPAVDPMRDATELLTDQLMRNIEADLVEQIDATSDYAASHSTTLVGVNQWNDYTNSDPLGDIDDGIEQIISVTGIRPTDLVIPWQVWNKLQRHPDVLGKMPDNTERLATPQLFARMVGIPNVHVPFGIKDTAKEGQSSSYSYIWGKDVYLFISPKALNLKQFRYGLHAATPLPNAEGQRDGVAVHVINKNPPFGLNFATFVAVRKSARFNLVSNEGGYFIENAVA